jgi:hypothetical protein
MSFGWVACSVRARAMTRRRVGRVTARRLATQPSLATALTTLADTPYGRGVRPGQTLDEVQRVVVDSVLWNVRVLAGWAPRDGVAMLRVLVGVLEAANVIDHLQRLAGADVAPPYRLGRLGTVWPRVSNAGTAEEVRRILTASPWGDPRSATVRDVALSMRLALADRVTAAVPLATAWAAGAAALLVAREQRLGRRELPPVARTNAVRVLGQAPVAAATLPDLTAALASSARWALTGVERADDLWSAEARWWARVERDAFALVRRPTPGPEVLVGAVALLAVDVWRVRAALELAARGGQPAEVFDAVA